MATVTSPEDRDDVPTGPPEGVGREEYRVRGLWYTTRRIRKTPWTMSRPAARDRFHEIRQTADWLMLCVEIRYPGTDLPNQRVASPDAIDGGVRFDV